MAAKTHPQRAVSPPLAIQSQQPARAHLANGVHSSPSQETLPKRSKKGWVQKMGSFFRAGCGGQSCSVSIPDLFTDSDGDSTADSSSSELPSPTDSQVSYLASEEFKEHMEQVFNHHGLMPEHVDIKISQRYKISHQELGSGGYGKVFIAEDREIPGRKVAIKKMLAVKTSRKETFRQEVSVMKRLDHPNICKLLETYDEGRHVFLVMEYCDAGELFDLIVGTGISEAMCSDVVRQCAGALKYAHSHGVAHRDLKPENVCLVSSGKNSESWDWSALSGRPRTHIKVIDWGLSKFFEAGHDGEEQADLHRMNSNVGSIAYTAPEVLEGSGGYTAAVDLWSLGVLMYVALSGRFPFGAKTSAEQLLLQKNTSTVAIRASISKFSTDAKDLISGLLRTDVSARFTANDVLMHKFVRRSSSKWWGAPRNVGLAKGVLSNLHLGSQEQFAASVFAALAAKQLDHHSLRELPQVFLEFDLDGNGELEFEEVRMAFESHFGKDSQEVKEAERTFALLDLDGSGTVDYTEFCAWGLRQRLNDESVIKAAFKAFDLHDNDGLISRKEFEEVLANANIKGSLVATDQVFSRFDTNGDGVLSFEEWKAWACGLLSPNPNQQVKYAD